MKYEAVIGLEVHAELQTKTKMFCSCAVVDATQASPNSAVCPVCAGMPGVLPVVNQAAVDYALRVALALNCRINPTSLFARKNYFYPDLPKGYQISQYEYPLAEHGTLTIDTPLGERTIRIRRVHLEEDTGKLTHVSPEGEEPYSLVDLNRAGVPLLEIVSEPELHTAEEAAAYGTTLRELVRALGVNSGDMEKGVIRFEANVSIRPSGSQALSTRVEIKNLNTFRGMERAIRFEIERQSQLVDRGLVVVQETLGWNEALGETYSQRGKEEAHDYRYFPEPDLPPLVVDEAWIKNVLANLPELPRAKVFRYNQNYGLNPEDARAIASDTATASYFEATLKAAPGISPQIVANWITGQLFAWMNSSGERFSEIKIEPADLATLLNYVNTGKINQNTAKQVLDTMLRTGREAGEIIQSENLGQVSDPALITAMVSKVLAKHPQELEAYLNGKETLQNWFFGQTMRAAGGQANPQVLRQELERQLSAKKEK